MRHTRAHASSSPLPRPCPTAQCPGCRLDAGAHLSLHPSICPAPCRTFPRLLYSPCDALCCVPGQWPQPSLRLRTAPTSRGPARADARAYTYHSDREPDRCHAASVYSLDHPFLTLSRLSLRPTPRSTLGLPLQRRGQRHLQSGAAGARAVLARGVTAAHPASRRCPCRCPCAAEVDARAVRAPSVTWLSPLPGGPCAAQR